SSNKGGSISSGAPLPAGYQMQFGFKDQLIVRPSEMLMHFGSLNLADAKTGAISAHIRVFLFPDLLLLAKAGSQAERDQNSLIYELLRAPIHIHQITQCFVMKGNSDLSIKYIGPDGRSQEHLRLRCQPGERDCHIWCRRIQDRLLQTVIL
uniref:PH domain-containing protein n=1 Tax=Macrostomum lignano TaxID=282301 RepID=A0A1I8G3B3_9PLAT